MKKVHEVIKLNQEVWLKQYIDMNTELNTEKNAKNDFEKDFQLMNVAAFGKIIENVRKHRVIKLITTQARRNQTII